MDEELMEELAKIAKDFTNKSMQVRADAVLDATELLSEHGLSWSKVFGQVSPNLKENETGRSFSGFIPFSKDDEPIYDEARGYCLLIATSDERKRLYKIMAKEDQTLRDLNEDDYKLIQHLRDEARRLRDLMANEVFVLKSGRVCRLVVKNS